MLFDYRKKCDGCRLECDLFNILEDIISALEPVSDRVIEVCFRKHTNMSEVVCRLRPFSIDSPEFIGIGPTYKEAMFKLIESLHEYAIYMSKKTP